MSDELLPCPFCGNDAPNMVELGPDDFYVECGKCTAQMIIVDGGPEQAAKNWNRRAQSAEIARLTRERDAARRDCAEAYQVVAVLASAVGGQAVVTAEDVVRALDNLSAASNGEPRPHDDLLPFPRAALSPSESSRP